MDKLPFNLERKHSVTGRQTRSYALTLKAVGTDGQVEGYGSVFGVRDHYDDVIAPGAFMASLAAHKAAGTLPAMLWQHSADAPLGVWEEMKEDSNGLYVKGTLCLETTLGKEAYALLKMKAINGLSIGFVSKEWTYERDSEIRTLTAIDLWEVSLVTFPANEQARVTGIKSVDEWASPKDAERTLREAGFTRQAATALVSRVMQMGEVRSESVASGLQAANLAVTRLHSLLTN